MARVKYYDSTTQTWKYADMALQTGIHVGTTAPTNEAMLWVDTASNQIDSFPLTDVQDSDGNSLIVNQIAVIPSMPSGTNNGDILVWDGDEWVSKPKWQMIYQPVEYIESTGTQRINVGIYPSASTRLVIQENYTDTTTYSLEGVSEKNCFFTWGVTSRKEYFESRLGVSSAQWQVSTIPVDTSVHTWDLQSGSQKIDDTIIATDTMPATSTVQLTLFGRQTGTWEIAKVKLYYCKIYESGTLVRDYIPVRNVFTGEGGLYDLANGKFYGNAGTGNFIIGAYVN